jgi:glycerol-3-phosphate dehydrogenase
LKYSLAVQCIVNYKINMESNGLKHFNRDWFIEELEHEDQWDVIIIGGGATGLGSALDAASRGYKTLLLEQADFAKGTSSRSTKLVHGGVRYLAQGDIALVYEALKERGTLLKNAAHLVKAQEFIIPCYDWKSVAMYFAGLKLYDWLSGRLSFGKSEFLSAKEVIAAMPTLNVKNLKGGIRYFDGQFDDARLAINIAQTCAEKGGTLLNYFKVTGLLKTDGKLSGVKAIDLELNKEYLLQAKVVINATGVFVDEILQLDQANGRPTVVPSQGAHIVLDKSFLPGYSAMMIPKTSDGRVLFAVPWHDYLVLGTTDTPLNNHSLEPVALDQEVDFILDTAGKYLMRPPKRKDILSIFAGLRPLAAPSKSTGSTKEISRSHKITVTASGLLTITGGKWTTYRKMAEDTINRAIKIGKLTPQSCTTTQISIHGSEVKGSIPSLAAYGSDAEKIQLLMSSDAAMAEKLSVELPYFVGEVIWAIRFEMARTLEDVLSRRIRLLFLNAKAAIALGPKVAGIMAKELGYDRLWEASQVEAFHEIASHYLPEKYLPDKAENQRNKPGKVS